MRYLAVLLILVAGTARAQWNVVNPPSSGGGGGNLPDPVTIAHGGTGATTQGAALTALGGAAAATTISTTAPITGGGDLSTGRTIAMPAATNSVNGYLTSAEHTTFAAAAPSTRAISATAPLTGGGDLSSNRSIAIPAATGSADGYLAHGDWTTFNSKAASGANADITSLSKIGQTGITLLDGQGTPNDINIIAPTTVNTSWTLTLPADASTTSQQPLCSTANGGTLTWCSALTDVITTTSLNTKLADNVAAKNPAFFYCEANVTLSGTQTCDVLSAGGGPALVANQTDNTTNGLYTTNAFGAWTYDTTWDPNNCDGMIVAVGTGGTSFGNTLWESVCPAGGNSGGVTFKQIPAPTRAGTCAVSSTTLSTTATNLTCAGVPASTHVAVQCSGQAAFSTPTANGVYCRATGTVDQIACNTNAANTTAMAFNCQWMQP